EVGEVVLVNARKSYQWGKRPDWFGRRETYGGTIGWVGIHALDMIHYTTGQRFVSVAAMQSNLTHLDRPACEDNCALILELANGAHATVSLDYCRPSTAPTHGDDWIRVVGERGALEANGSRETCGLIAEGQAPRDVPLAPTPSMYRAFLLSLLGQAEFAIQQPADPFLLTHACLCARDAADSRSIVRIPQGVWD
ncbi:MAG: Gfo/Idh/MocA family oxidoreductase, partial [Candidatus Sumerlaeota bacterium]|nr:Gfo/Idh/MocA family oxidoreductase [Candidatus Sumerlaeota bacterium]